MTKANKDKVAKGFRDAKGGNLKVADLLPTKFKKKLVASIQQKDRKP